MGYREYLLWFRYRKKYGPLNPVRMYDRSGAIVATQINNAYGGKARFEDFATFGIEAKEKQEISDYIQSAFGGKVKIGKRKRR